MKNLAIFAVMAMFAMGHAQFWNGKARPLPPTKEVEENVDIVQNLGGLIPLDAEFTDSDGQKVKIGDLLQGKPALLTPVYYNCPNLCTETLNRTVHALLKVELRPGDDYNIITYSIAPTETPELAAKKKENYVGLLKKEGAEQGWHFLVGSQESIKVVSEAVGFKYLYLEKQDLYAHKPALIFLTPDGKISRYFLGLLYNPRDVRLSLVEASNNKIGQLSDKWQLFCYVYDPESGTYGFAVMRALRIGGVMTIIAMAGMIFYFSRRKPGGAGA